MAYNDWTLDAIDERIAQSSRRDITMATVSTVTDGTTNVFLATMDGSNQAVPVKTFGNFRIVEGDRIGLIRFGSDWVAIGTYGQNRRNLAVVNADWSAANTTSASYANAPGPITLTFNKYRATSLLAVTFLTNCFTTVGATEVQWGVSINAVDYDLTHFNFSAVSHDTQAAFITVSGLSAALGWLATVRWKRLSGTGAVSVNTTNHVAMAIEEIF